MGAVAMTTLTFWYEFASTYSYLSAMRIDALAEEYNVDVHWRPFLLAPIFASQGWDNSPFNIYPVKGKYMWRDMARQAEKYGIPMSPPTPDFIWPRMTVKPARIAIFGMEEGWGREFTRLVYQAQFVDHADISNVKVLGALVEKAGGNAEHALVSADMDEYKGHLRANTDEAIDRGLFGAPSFTVGDELIWGDDRLEDAMEWAIKHG